MLRRISTVEHNFYCYLLYLPYFGLESILLFYSYQIDDSHRTRQHSAQNLVRCYLNRDNTWISGSGGQHDVDVSMTYGKVPRMLNASPTPERHRKIWQSRSCAAAPKNLFFFLRRPRRRIIAARTSPLLSYLKAGASPSATNDVALQFYFYLPHHAAWSARDRRTRRLHLLTTSPLPCRHGSSYLPYEDKDMLIN